MQRHWPQSARENERVPSNPRNDQPTGAPNTEQEHTASIENDGDWRFVGPRRSRSRRRHGDANGPYTNLSAMRGTERDPNSSNRLVRNGPYDFNLPGRSMTSRARKNPLSPMSNRFQLLQPVIAENEASLGVEDTEPNRTTASVVGTPHLLGSPARHPSVLRSPEPWPIVTGTANASRPRQISPQRGRNTVISQFLPGVIILAPYLIQHFDDPTCLDNSDVILVPSIGYISAKMRPMIIHSVYPNHLVACPIFTSNGRGLSRKPLAVQDDCLLLCSPGQPPPYPGVDPQLVLMTEGLWQARPNAYALISDLYTLDLRAPQRILGGIDEASQNLMTRYSDMLQRKGRMPLNDQRKWQRAFIENDLFPKSAVASPSDKGKRPGMIKRMAKRFRDVSGSLRGSGSSPDVRADAAPTPNPSSSAMGTPVVAQGENP